MNLGFVSTRFSSTDGVSLEAQKWADAFERIGHSSFWFSGLSDRPSQSSMVIPEAFFEHPEIVSINEKLWNVETLPDDVVSSVEKISNLLRHQIAEFCQRFEIDLLIPQNALTIPMNFPLGLALTDYIDTSGIPTVAHHHDFCWERECFSGAGAQPFLDRAFPPAFQSITHVVINSEAGKQLNRRFGLESIFVPNVMNFEATPSAPVSPETIKSKLGLADGDIIFLQPTRVVPERASNTPSNLWRVSRTLRSNLSYHTNPETKGITTSTNLPPLPHLAG